MIAIIMLCNVYRPRAKPLMSPFASPCTRHSMHYGPHSGDGLNKNASSWCNAGESITKLPNTCATVYYPIGRHLLLDVGYWYCWHSACGLLSTPWMRLLLVPRILLPRCPSWTTITIDLRLSNTPISCTLEAMNSRRVSLPGQSILLARCHPETSRHPGNQGLCADATDEEGLEDM